MGVDYAMKRSFKTHEVSRMDASPRLLDLLRQVLDASRRGEPISAASGTVVARLGGCPLDPHFETTALNTARTGSISAFQLGQQFGSFGLGSGFSHDFAPLHRLTLVFGHACRTIR